MTFGQLAEGISSLGNRMRTFARSKMGTLFGATLATTAAGQVEAAVNPVEDLANPTKVEWKAAPVKSDGTGVAAHFGIDFADMKTMELRERTPGSEHYVVVPRYAYGNTLQPGKEYALVQTGSMTDASPTHTPAAEQTTNTSEHPSHSWGTVTVEKPGIGALEIVNTGLGLELSQTDLANAKLVFKDARDTVVAPTNLWVGETYTIHGVTTKPGAATEAQGVTAPQNTAGNTKQIDISEAYADVGQPIPPAAAVYTAALAPMHVAAALRTDLSQVTPQAKPPIGQLAQMGVVPNPKAPALSALAARTVAASADVAASTTGTATAETMTTQTTVASLGIPVPVAKPMPPVRGLLAKNGAVPGEKPETPKPSAPAHTPLVATDETIGRTDNTPGIDAEGVMRKRVETLIAVGIDADTAASIAPQLSEKNTRDVVATINLFAKKVIAIFGDRSGMVEFGTPILLNELIQFAAQNNNGKLPDFPVKTGVIRRAVQKQIGHKVSSIFEGKGIHRKKPFRKNDVQHGVLTTDLAGLTENTKHTLGRFGELVLLYGGTGVTLTDARRNPNGPVKVSSSSAWAGESYDAGFTNPDGTAWRKAEEVIAIIKAAITLQNEMGVRATVENFHQVPRGIREQVIQQLKQEGWYGKIRFIHNKFATGPHIDFKIDDSAVVAAMSQTNEWWTIALERTDETAAVATQERGKDNIRGTLNDDVLSKHISTPANPQTELGTAFNGAANDRTNFANPDTNLSSVLPAAANSEGNSTKTDDLLGDTDQPATDEVTHRFEPKVTPDITATGILEDLAPLARQIVAERGYANRYSQAAARLDTVGAKRGWLSGTDSKILDGAMIACSALETDTQLLAVTRETLRMAKEYAALHPDHAEAYTSATKQLRAKEVRLASRIEVGKQELHQTLAELQPALTKIDQRMQNMKAAHARRAESRRRTAGLMRELAKKYATQKTRAA